MKMKRLDAHGPAPALDGGDWGVAERPAGRLDDAMDRGTPAPTLTAGDLAEIEGRDQALDPDLAALFLRLDPGIPEPFVNAVRDRRRLIAGFKAERTDAAGGAAPAITSDADPVGLAEIADRLDVATITVKKWRERHADFPAARWTVSGRPAWEWAEVKAWAAVKRSAGRRRP